MKLFQLLQILQLDKNSFDSNVDLQVEMVSIYLDIDPQEIYEWNKDKLDQQVLIIQKVVNATSKVKEQISHDGYTFYKMPFSKLTLGEYIDIEYFMVKPDGILQLISIIYRKAKPKTRLTDYQYEKYGDWLNVRTEFFKDIQVADVVGLKSEFLEWRKLLHQSYSGLFDQGYDGDEEETPPDNLSKIEKAKQDSTEKAQTAFTWENIIINLCDNNLANYEDILNLPIILVFNILSAKKMNQVS